MDESTSGPQLTNAIASDQRIGSYRVIDPLGSGGMSSVFRAVHEETGHEVALKVLTRTLARNSTLLQRFLREARSAEALQHPNIVTIYDRGIDRGRHYLVLEYVPGGDFHDFIQRRGPLSTAEAVSVIKSVAAGLKYAASLGVIHRDIKPSNILRTPAGQVKIIDLGLALQNAFEDERVTREGTTVGTVDYMAPEQARDSRATSIQSDIYSLGCTFYYFLTGVAAYPGGDITDKLTRHVKSPVPDVRDLRLDVPERIAAVIQRMMAKRPEDRFASYDDLIAALEAAPLDGLDKPPTISVIPLADEVGAEPSPSAIDPWPSRASGEYANNGSDSGRLQIASLADLAGERSGEFPERPAARSQAPEAPPLILRRGPLESEQLEPGPADIDELPEVAPSSAASSAPVWIISVALLGFAVVLLTVGVLQYVDSSASPHEETVKSTEAEVSADRPIVASTRAGLSGVARGGRSSDRVTRRLPPESRTAPSFTEPKWVEPADTEPSLTDGAGARVPAGPRFLPDWARSPVPDRIDGPFVVVRRVVDTPDPTTVSTLHTALDSFIGGTIELADEGPHFVDDLRVAGEARLIRARPGFRPIVRVEHSNLEAVRKQSAVFVLDRKNLTLVGIDLVVDVRDLSSEQKSLFSCSGTNLTLRDCSVTVLNDTKAAFSVISVDANATRPTRVRLDRTLVRGQFAAGFDLAGGTSAVVLERSVMLGAALVHIVDSEAAVDRRLYFSESIVAGPGPVIQWSRKESGPQTMPLLVRSFGSVFGRFHGFGVATVISSSSAVDAAAKQVDWEGDNNLFAGWKGFFASGSDPTVTIPDLAAVRSTWNKAERESREILLPWPYTADPARATPASIGPFVPTGETILQQVARPRAGLFEKAIGAFTSPAMPQPAGWALDRTNQPQKRPLRVAPIAAQTAVEGSLTQAAIAASASRPRPTSGQIQDLTFDTQAQPWSGDLGAFLRDRLTAGLKHVRVLVVGSGAHRFTPVKLPDGVYLEIRVEALAVSEPPSWSPEPNATGLALIEQRHGALVMSNVVLRHQDAPHLGELIHVEDGHLVLSRCRLTAMGSAADDAGDLIAFRSPSTQPYPSDASGPLFSTYVDRPVCRLDETILITGGTALKAELGRGVIALSECAIAAGDTGVALVSSRVARSRFEADLILDHCTLTSERSIIRVGPWNGSPPGPDRPWLITSRNCAFLAMYDRRTRETILLRADADALARGVVCWQAADDAVDVDFFTAGGEAVPLLNRSRDVQQQWIHFWGYNHVNGRMTGPRGAGSPPSVRFWDRLRPGRVEPADLVLNPDYHPERDRLNVGADLVRLGITPRTSRFVRPHN